MSITLGSGRKENINNHSGTNFTRTDKIVAGLTGLAALVALSQQPYIKNKAVNGFSQVRDTGLHAANWVGDTIQYGRGKYRMGAAIGDGYKTFLDLGYQDPELASFIKYMNGFPEGAVIVPSDKPVMTLVEDPKGETVHEIADKLKAQYQPK